MTIRDAKWRIYRVTRPANTEEAGAEESVRWETSYDHRAKGGRGPYEFAEPGVVHDVVLLPDGVARLREAGWIVDDGREPETAEERRWLENVVAQAENEEAARATVFGKLSPHGDYRAALYVLRFGALTEENPWKALRDLREDHEEFKPVVSHVEWLAGLRRELEDKGWKFDFSKRPPRAREPSGPEGGRGAEFPNSLIRNLYESFQLQYGVEGKRRDLRQYVSERLQELFGLTVSEADVLSAVDYLLRQDRRPPDDGS